MESKTVAELRAMCKERKLRGHSTKPRDELLAMLRRADETVAAEASFPSATELLNDEEHQKLGELRFILQEVGNTLHKGRAEGVYQKAILIELQMRGIMADTEETVPIMYKGRYVGQERIDIALTTWLPLILELKAIAKIKEENFWQVLSYMRYKKQQLGVVVNYCQTTDGPLEFAAVVLDDTDTAYKLDLENDRAIPMRDYDYRPT